MKTIKKSDSIDIAPWKAKGGELLPVSSARPRAAAGRSAGGWLDQL